MSNEINFDLLWDFKDKFGGGIGYNLCYNGEHCYENGKTGKVYYLKSLTDEQLESLMKKSLASGHDYLLDAVKDNECPPYDTNLIY